MCPRSPNFWLNHGSGARVILGDVLYENFNDHLIISCNRYFDV